MGLDEYYFGCDFFYCCPHIYCDKLKHIVSVALSSGLPQVSLVYLGTEIIQPRKLFLLFDNWSNKALFLKKDYIYTTYNFGGSMKPQWFLWGSGHSWTHGSKEALVSHIRRLIHTIQYWQPFIDKTLTWHSPKYHKLLKIWMNEMIYLRWKC